MAAEAGPVERADSTRLPATVPSRAVLRIVRMVVVLLFYGFYGFYGVSGWRRVSRPRR